MRPAVLVVTLAACAHGSSGGGRAADSSEAALDATVVSDGEPAPAYDTAAVQDALIAERAAEARGERELDDAEASGDPDRVVAARADLAVRRRFFAMLEFCEARRQLCPPRLDDPPWPYAIDGDEDPKLDVPLRFDATTWPKVAAELHGRACACRTQTCLDSMDAMLARLETRPTEDVQTDETAIVELTRARECTMRLRGKRQFR
jgi:hypothetical protein